MAAKQVLMTDQGPAPEYAVLDGRIVPFGDARVHILTHTFNYGTGVFEGIRGYWNGRRDELFIVRLREHIERLVANSRVLMLDAGYSAGEIADLCLELVRKNELRQDTYIRPIIYCPALRVGPGMSDEHALAIYNIPMGHYHDPSRAIDVMVSTWRRTNDNAIPARGKINGAYVNSSLAITEARRAGFDDAILLNQDGHVSEGSVMNVFIVRRAVLRRRGLLLRDRGEGARRRIRRSEGRRAWRRRAGHGETPEVV
jgi:branched-chain amino acid aminotransferase